MDTLKDKLYNAALNVVAIVTTTAFGAVVLYIMSL